MEGWIRQMLSGDYIVIDNLQETSEYQVLWNHRCTCGTNVHRFCGSTPSHEFTSPRTCIHFLDSIFINTHVLSLSHRYPQIYVPTNKCWLPTNTDPHELKWIQLSACNTISCNVSHLKSVWSVDFCHMIS
jgi:hypothetical protein